MKQGRAGTMTHDYKRNGTTTLFAALNVLDGTVIGRNMKRHRHQEFIRFLNEVDAQVPKRKVIHAIVDNYATHKHPKVREWLATTSALDLPLHADLGLLAQCRRGLLRQTHQAGASSAASSDRSPSSQIAIKRFIAEANAEPKALRLDRTPKPHPRSCQTRETSVRVNPLAFKAI